MNDAEQVQASLLESVRRACNEFNLIAQGERVAVAVSGGKDSRALLELLLHLRRERPYNCHVVALHVVPATVINPGDEPYEFKYITIRTPVPKVNFINFEDSQKLEGYHRGVVWGVDTSVISVMPPFNFPHTGMEDIQALREKEKSPPNPVSGSSRSCV